MSLTPIPTGNDTQVNTYTIGDQNFPSVTALLGGGFIVTWMSYGQDGSGYGIYAQRYDASGATVGSEFRVNTTTSNDQIYASTAALPDGGFVVTWNSQNQDGSDWGGIYTQRYAADGTAIGGEIQVNTTTPDAQLHSSATTLSDGGFVVTWSSHGQDGNGWGVYGQRYAANGTTVGGEFRVNTTTSDDQMSPNGAALDDGGFVIIWGSHGQDGNGWGVYGQRYAVNGTAVGGEVQINTTTSGDELWPTVATLTDGGYVVAWSSLSSAGSWRMFGQRYAADGTAVASEFLIEDSSATNNQQMASITALGDGGFVVTWTAFGQDGDGYGIYGQRYAADGLAAGSKFLVNEITAGDQFVEVFYGANAVATLSDGRLVQVWAGLGGAGEVFFRLVNVPSANTAPTITSAATASVSENTAAAAVVYNADATDPDVTDTLSFSLTGADAELFSIDADDGEVRFLASPDFDAPADTGGNNVYDIVVHANDGAHDTTKAVAITVTNVGGETWVGGNGGQTHTGTGEEDSLVGGAGKDIINGGGGDDTIEGGNDADTLSGDLGDDWLAGGAGKDIISGGDGDDSIEGGNDADTVSGDLGSDWLAGGAGKDIIDGGDGDDSIEGGNDADTLSGDLGGDWLAGDAGKDIISGGDGDDSIEGGNDADTLSGNLGNDWLAGGNGSDTFVFDSSFGNDIITDFKPNTDTITIDDALFANFAAVQSNAFNDGFGNTVLIYDANNTITLMGVLVAQLDADDFTFF